MTQALLALLEEMNSPGSPKSTKILQHDYESWAAGFVFEAMRDQRYGQSFCNRFGIKDNILFYERDLARADAYIRKHYVKRCRK